MTDPKPAIIYARMSPRRDPERSASIETQIDLCRAWCKREGFVVLGVYRDPNVKRNAPLKDRPGLMDAIACCKRGTSLLVYRPDRFAAGDQGAILRAELRRRRIRLRAVEDDFDDDSASGRLVARIYEAVHEFSRELTAARTRAAMLRHQAAGRRMSNTCPYGWRRDPTNAAMMVEHGDEQRLIQTILLWHEGGTSNHGIARMLDLANQPCRGRRWWHTTIRNIVRRAKQKPGYNPKSP